MKLWIQLFLRDHESGRANAGLTIPNLQIRNFMKSLFEENRDPC